MSQACTWSAFSLMVAGSAFAQDEEPPTDAIEAAEEADIVRGLSWDIVAAGVPSAGAIGHAELGFTGLPRVAYHHTLQPGLSLGGLVAFDYGSYVPKGVFTPSLIVAVPIRYSVYRDDTWGFVIRADPGLLFGFDPGVVGVRAEISGIVGFQVEDRFVVGGGIDVPITFGIPTGGGSVFLAAPLLFGPVAEFHVTPPLAITLDAKFGPGFSTNTKTLFAMRIHAGVALRF